jgi:hypothetical protein
MAAQWLSQYMGKQPDPAVTDAMIANMIANSSLPHADHEVALEWAASISDTTLQSQSMERIIQDWGTDDPAAATSYISKNTTLAPEQKQRLLQAIQNPNAP